MQRIVSVSLGSSKRNSRVEVNILNRDFVIERVGTDGDIRKAISLIKEMDGKVDAFGMGGIDLFITAGKRRYAFRDALKIAGAAKKTPIVDGTGLKNTLERKVINDLANTGYFKWEDTKVFLVSGADRFGMAQAFTENKAQIIFGDLMVALGLPLPITSLSALERLAYIVAPLICKLPFQYLYPTGKKQGRSYPRFRKYYEWADVIAGDFHYIWKYMPDSLKNKSIVTNTITKNDIEEIKKRGAKFLITTTPELDGRSFGTNVMEALMVVLIGKKPEEIKTEEYLSILDAVKFRPRVIDFSLEDSRNDKCAEGDG